MSAYYNEIDPQAAEWLRELIKAGVIPPGDVDERSIEDVRPDDLAGYVQCHFFAGIGGWAYALRLAGWPDDRPVWTGSCPCQPFSAAGKRKGAADERHLWPAFYWLIDQCRPPRVFGEQVAQKVGRQWLAGVRADLEAVGYAVGAADLCAAGVGAPHIRQRLWWMADPNSRQFEGLAVMRGDERDGEDAGRTEGSRSVAAYSAARGLGDTERARLERHAGHEPDRDEPGRQHADADGPATETGGWSDYIWLPCADGKARRFKPGLEPLVNGLPGRVGLLRGYGNAIVPRLAAQFIEACEEVRAA